MLLLPGQLRTSSQGPHQLGAGSEPAFLNKNQAGGGGGGDLRRGPHLRRRVKTSHGAAARVTFNAVPVLRGRLGGSLLG